MVKRKAKHHSHRLHMPKTKLGKVLAVTVMLAVVLMGATAYLWWKGAVSTHDLQNLSALGSGDGSVVIAGPAQGAIVTPGTTIHGSSVGAGHVNVWVSGVNFATPVTMQGSSWSYEYTGGLDGDKTLNFAVVDGIKWGAPASVTYAFATTTAPTGTQSGTSYWSDNLPSGVGQVFHPIEGAVRGAVSVVTTFVDGLLGGGSGDLDNNGVNDRWQGNPLDPSGHILGRIPYVTAAVAIVAVLMVGLFLIIRGKVLLQYVLRRKELKTRVKTAEARSEEKKVNAAKELAVKKFGLIERLSKAKLRTIAGLKRTQIKAQEGVLKEQLHVQGSVVQAQRDVRVKIVDAESQRIKTVADLRKKLAGFGKGG